MLELAHFAVGAGLTSLLLTLMPISVRYPRTTMVLGGLWGMLPDIHWVLPILADPVHAFHNTSLANVFWFHHLLDALDPADSKTTSALAFGGLIVAVAVGEWHQYHTPPDLDRFYDRLTGRFERLVERLRS